MEWLQRGRGRTRRKSLSSSILIRIRRLNAIDCSKPHSKQRMASLKIFSFITSTHAFTVAQGRHQEFLFDDGVSHFGHGLGNGNDAIEFLIITRTRQSIIASTFLSQIINDKDKGTASTTVYANFLLQYF